MSAWLKFSPRTRTALKVLALTSLAMTLFCLTPLYRATELRYFDLRLRTWESLTIFEMDVQLLSVRESTQKSGFGDQELADFLHELQDLGAKRIVLLGTEVFEDLETYSSMLPQNVLVIDSQDKTGREILFRDPEAAARQLDPDGILRSLEPDHPAVLLWKDLLHDFPTDSEQRVFLHPLERVDEVSYEGTTRDTPIETFKQGVEQAAGFSAAQLNLTGRIILVQRTTSAATESLELPTSTGPATEGQIHQQIAQSVSQNWNLVRFGWFPSLVASFFLIGGFVMSLSGRKPMVVCALSITLISLVYVASVALLPLGIDFRAAFLTVAIGLAMLFLILSELGQSRKFLKQFGGAEDAGFSGEESQATMVFTNLPKYLMDMEKNHDENLLKYRREYNEVLAVIARRYHGKVLDYQGDAQMLGFGLRYDDDNEHPVEAVSAALEIVEEVAKLAARWKAPAEALKVSAGVCTGSIALGHLGAIQKQDIAAIGDTTNTAARLMGAAMKNEVGVLISKPTYVQAEGLVTGTSLPPVELKGKSAPVEVYHATLVDPAWQAENRAKSKDVVPSGGTLTYTGRRQESLMLTVVMAIFGALISFNIWADEVLDVSELKLADNLHQAFGFVDADPDIVLIGIDDASVSDPQLGELPWSRGVYAQALENILATRCRGVFIDVLFRTPRSDDLEGDRYLAEVAEGDPRVVLAGTLVRDRRDRWEAPTLFPAVDPTLLQQRAQIGLIHNHRDPDGVTRWGFVCLTENASHNTREAEKRTTFPSAAAALLLNDAEELAILPGRVLLGERSISAQVSRTGHARIQLRFGPASTAEGREPEPGSYQLVSFRRLLDPQDPIFQDLDDKYILIGQTRTSGDSNQIDRASTLSGNIKGVEVHARILDNLLNKNYLRSVSRTNTELALLAVAGLSFVILARYREPREYLSRLGLLVGGLGIVYVLSFVLFNVLFQLLALWFTILLVSAGILMGRHIFTFRALTRFIPAEVAAELLFQGEAQDRRQIATVLLTDIRGYTTLSEGKSAVAMLDVLNEYHKRTVACYDRYGGQALTYQGDAQIVVFGVFGDRSNPAADAAAAALELQSICDVLREEWGIISRDDFDVGAGLCTGEVEVGLLGGGDNLQYSVVGETVRKAHKVQSLSNDLAAPVILDEETYLASRGAVAVDDLGMVQPKGLSHEIQLYRARSVSYQESSPTNRSNPDEDQDIQVKIH